MEPNQQSQLSQIKDGIYFAMPEEAYHAIPRLSASGIKQLIVSGPDFWGRSWMNPHKAEDETEKDHLDLGKAYHKRILEGAKAFEASYALEFENDDPGVIRTVDHIRDRLKEMELPVSFKNKAEGMARLIEAGVPEDEFFDALQAKYLARHEGKEFLPKKIMRRIEFAAATVEGDKQLAPLLKGGFSEVTVLWTDPATGVPMKARFDYWRAQGITDLKTFSNVFGKPLGKAVSGSVANYKYHVQVAVYLEAAERAAELAQGGAAFNFPDKPLTKAQAKFLAGAGAEPEFIFIFQQTGIAPLSLARRFPRDLLLLENGREAMRRGMDLFVHYYNSRKEAYWKPEAEDVLADFRDEDFPLWLLEQG